VAAEVQSRACGFCAAKRTLDGFFAATVQSPSDAKRSSCPLACRTSFPRTLRATRSRHLGILGGAMPP
jgi:hypothetical protein